MKSAPPPAYPDPMKTAAAQSGMNVDTAQAQQLVNQYDQVTPQGNVTWNQTGENTFINSQGKPVTIPKFTATQTYSPGQQQLYETGQQTEQQIANVGLEQSHRIGDLLGTPIDLSNEATEARLMELGSKRLNPRFAQEEEALRTRLVNQGVGEGSEAYNNAMTQFGQTKNDAFNQLLLSGRAQSVQEMLAQRNQPINEISALLSGSQVSQPNFVGTPNTPVAGVDYMGAVDKKYQAELGAWNAQQQSKNAMMGGIFGMLGSGISMFSDKRLKENIRPVGKLNDGTKIYSYNYKGNDAPQVGVMAQEAEKKHPDAIGSVLGFKTVDYSKIVEGQ